jgi:hypothetical protein
MEFYQTLRPYRRTPVELLDEAGMLGPQTTLGHCIMVSGHPQAFAEVYWSRRMHSSIGMDARLMRPFPTRFRGSNDG